MIQLKAFPEGTRKLGGLRSPVTLLKFSFEGFTGSEIDDFPRRFDPSFQRGGH